MSDPSGLLEIRRQRANHMRSLVNAGVSTKQIALDMGISRARVYQLLAFADLIEHAEQNPPLSPSIEIVQPAERPAWSYPDAVTKQLVADTRAEMENGRTPPFRE